jgi:hypothetical protein
VVIIVLPNWEDLPGLTRQSTKALYTLIKEELDNKSDKRKSTKKNNE